MVITRSNSARRKGGIMCVHPGIFLTIIRKNDQRYKRGALDGWRKGRHVLRREKRGFKRGRKREKKPDLQGQRESMQRDSPPTLRKKDHRTSGAGKPGKQRGKGGGKNPREGRGSWGLWRGCF